MFYNFNMLGVLCLCFFCFFVFLNSFWLGIFLFSFSNIFFILVFLSFIIFMLIVFSENSFFLVFLSFFLILFCVLFFLCGNIFLLYIFFELSIFPIVLMILGFGSQIEKINSCFYLLFYSSFCSLPFLVVIFSLDFFSLFVFISLFFSWEFYFFVCLLFLMKFPLFFLHLWLPKAHVEAPTSASMLLAGLLLKLGTGGFIRILSLLSFNFDYFLFLISFMGFILSCFMCLFQSDLKSLAAYSSINHMMFLLFLIINLSFWGFFSSLAIMISHGFISSLMFYFVGDFYHSSSTRMLYYFGGFSKVSSLFLVFFSLTWLFNGGAPFSISFFSEYIGIMMLFNISFFIFLLLFFYFFMSFYYTLYVLVSSFLSKNMLKIVFWNVFSVFFMIFWSLNIFCFNLIF